MSSLQVLGSAQLSTLKALFICYPISAILGSICQQYSEEKNWIVADNFELESIYQQLPDIGRYHTFVLLLKCLSVIVEGC